MKSLRVVAPLLIVAVVACSSSAAPRSGVTLLVNNETCAAGQCDSLIVVAFPGVQTGTPGGLWHLDLGLMTSSHACFTLPASAKFLVVDADSHDTATIGWSDVQGLSLAALPPNAEQLEAAPTTRSFVPAAAAGWAITLPSGTAAMSAESCVPDRGPTN